MKTRLLRLLATLFTLDLVALIVCVFGAIWTSGRDPLSMRLGETAGACAFLLFALAIGAVSVWNGVPSDIPAPPECHPVPCPPEIEANISRSDVKYSPEAIAAAQEFWREKP